MFLTDERKIRATKLTVNCSTFSVPLNVSRRVKHCCLVIVHRQVGTLCCVYIPNHVRGVSRHYLFRL